MDKCHIFVTLLIIKATELAFFSLKYCRLGQSNNYDTTLVSIKGTDRVIIKQYFVNNVTPRVWYLFFYCEVSTKPFNSLFDGSSTDYSPKIFCFEKVLPHPAI